MKLGLLTAAFPDLTLEQVADVGGRRGLRGARDRLLAGRRRRAAPLRRRHAHRRRRLRPGQGPRRRWSGTGSAISSLAYYPNNLHPDDAHREEVNGHLRKVIDAAAALGVGIVGTFVGNDKDRPLPENLQRFREIWPPLVDYAGERGVKIAIENCPMIFS